MIESIVKAFAHPFNKSSNHGIVGGSLGVGMDLTQVDPVGLNQLFKEYGILKPDRLSESDATELAALQGQFEAQGAVAQNVSKRAVGAARAALQLARIKVNHQKQMAAIHEQGAALAVDLTKFRAKHQLNMATQQEYVDAWSKVIDVNVQRMADW
jgi:hypothetical protein